jgi:hypothetical protein
MRTHLKNVFWPNLFVGASFQILDIQQYACGFKLSPAAILNQNPIFEIGSKITPGQEKNGSVLMCAETVPVAPLNFSIINTVLYIILY